MLLPFDWRVSASADYVCNVWCSVLGMRWQLVTLALFVALWLAIVLRHGAFNGHHGLQVPQLLSLLPPVCIHLIYLSLLVTQGVILCLLSLPSFVVDCIWILWFASYFATVNR